MTWGKVSWVGLSYPTLKVSLFLLTWEHPHHDGDVVQPAKSESEEREIL